MDKNMDIVATQAGHIEYFPTFAVDNNGTTVLLWQDR